MWLSFAAANIDLSISKFNCGRFRDFGSVFFCRVVRKDPWLAIT